MRGICPENSDGVADRPALYSAYSSVPERVPGQVERHRDVRGLLVPQHVDEHRREAEDGVRRLPGLRREVLGRQGVERPVGEGVSVEEEESSHARSLGHGTDTARTSVSARLRPRGPPARRRWRPRTARPRAERRRWSTCSRDSSEWRGSPSRELAVERAGGRHATHHGGGEPQPGEEAVGVPDLGRHVAGDLLGPDAVGVGRRGGEELSGDPVLAPPRGDVQLLDGDAGGVDEDAGRRVGEDEVAHRDAVADREVGAHLGAVEAGRAGCRRSRVAASPRGCSRPRGGWRPRGR